MSFLLFVAGRFPFGQELECFSRHLRYARNGYFIEVVPMDEDSLLGRAKTCCLVSIDENIEEARELCRTLGIEVAKNVVQRRPHPDPHTFIGTGKLEELKEVANEVDLFVFDGELKPSQHFRLEMTLKRLCTDRVGLVLEIFERNAGSKEAKAQVALARIRYELPFLREWVSKGLSDDRPGFMAGGEYVIDAYYENARRQMKRIEGELLRISAERESRRDRRRDTEGSEKQEPLKKQDSGAGEKEARRNFRMF